MRLTLPFPPSVNALYAGMRRRHKSKRYEAWLVEARNSIREQGMPKAPVGVIEVTYRFCQPDKRRRDLFNLEKAISDVLVDMKVIEDDSLIHRGVVEWSELPGATVDIVSFQNGGDN